MLNDIYDMVKANMDKTISALNRELNSVRSGRATVSMLDGIKVDYYGQMTPLNQLASVSAPEATLLVVQPWDPGSIPAIEKAIQRSSLNLNPNNDGKLIRIPVPPLTEDRRKEIVKYVKKITEQTKVSIRNERRGGNDMLKDLEKEKEISEDEMHRGFDKIQEIHDDYIKKVDEKAQKKEDEIMTV